MYRTYSTRDSRAVYPYEERLLPKKEPSEPSKAPQAQTAALPESLFRDNDELLLLGILLFLLCGECNDRLLILVLAVLLFFPEK